MNKKLLVSAVSGALAFGVSGLPALASHDSSNDDTVLIPYVVKDTNRTTIVTLIGTGSPVSSGPSIHLQYWTKSTTAANTAACEPSSTTLTFTDNDIVTFDTAGLLGAGPLFGDTTNLAPLGTSISYAGPRHGYLLVDDPSGNRQGYWVEVDLANGGAHGDWALGSDDDTDFSELMPSSVLKATDGGNFTGGFDDHRGVPFWPTPLVSTAFTVTPLGYAMLTSDNNQVTLQVQNANGVQGAYDRNENGVDGTVPNTVRCVGRLTAAQLMPGVVSNAAWAAQGGWGFLRNLGDNDGSGNYNSDGSPTDTGDLDAVVYQVDTSSAAGAGKFMSNATRINTMSSDKISNYIGNSFTDILGSGGL